MRAIASPSLILLLLSLLAVMGCQAQSATVTPAATATDSVTPAADEATVELTPAGATAASAITGGKRPATQTPDATGESDTSERETPMVTKTVSEPEDQAAESQANADVEFVRAAQSPEGAWTFHVTVRHPDTGWEDYADGWDVVTPDGEVLKTGAAEPFTRLLLHPHENEQPFTRSQSGIVVPDGITSVTVRAHDLVDGFGGRQVVVDLTLERGPDFEVQRP